MRQDQRGFVVITAIIVVAAVSVGTLAVPLAVNAIDVGPDNPFYDLERLGEQIQGVSTIDQMKERFGEYRGVTERGGGTEYMWVLDEFYELMTKVVEETPNEVLAAQGVTDWMQEQVSGIVVVKADLAEDLAGELNDEISGMPVLSMMLVNLQGELGELKGQLQGVSMSDDNTENVELRIDEILYQLRYIAMRNRARIGTKLMWKVQLCNWIHAKLDEISIPMWAEAWIGEENQSIDELWELVLELFDNRYNEVENLIAYLENEENLALPGPNYRVELVLELKDHAVKVYELSDEIALRMLVRAYRRLGRIEWDLWRIAVFADQYPYLVEDIQQRIEALPDTINEEQLYDMLETAQMRFEQGNYRVAAGYLRTLELLLTVLEMGS